MIREWIVQTVYFVCVGANCKISQKGVKLGQASQNKFNVACWGWGVEATIKFYSILDMFCVLDPWKFTDCVLDPWNFKERCMELFMMIGLHTVFGVVAGNMAL
jgi:hypothetical protein